MARPQNPDLTKNWKVCLPATLAGTVEFYLFDRLHNKPKYGSRAQLLTRLLSDWVAEQKDPNARAKAILERILHDAGTLSIDGGTLYTALDRYQHDLLEAIKKGLETELAPSASSIPSSISSLA